MAKNSAGGAYAKSSFDAIETTRRLSDELSVTDNSIRYGVQRKMVDIEDYNNDAPPYSEDESGMIKVKGTESNGRLDGGGMPCYDSNVTGYSSRRQSFVSTSNNDVGFTSSSLGSIAKESSTETNEDKFHNEDKITEYDEDDDDIMDDKGGVNNFDQRSVSDSDMDSPDDFDFDGKTYNTDIQGAYDDDKNIDLSNKSDMLKDVNDNITTKHGGETQSEYNNYGKSKNSNSLNDNNNSNNNSNNNNSHRVESSKVTNDKNGRLNCSNEDYNIKNKTNGLVNTDETILSNSDDADVNEKVNDEDVINQSEKLDVVKDIGFCNMSQLQHLDRNDPAIRRLIMRPRVSPGETKTLKVDPDIKSMVNEFLRTNVTENFIIARVLRENYALFYSWLATHIQTERNAWAARLGQALENADQERKGSLEYKNLVVEAATRLRTLAKTVSSSLFDIPGHTGDKTLFRKGQSLRQGHVKSFKSTVGCGGGAKRPMNGGNSDTNDVCSSKINSFLSFEGKQSNDIAPSVLRQSSFNMIEVSDVRNYESDPGTGKCNYEVRKKPTRPIIVVNGNNQNQNQNQNQTISKQARDSVENNNNNKQFSKTRTDNADTNGGNVHVNIEDMECMPFGYSINGIVVEYDDDMDWKQVLTESIDILMEICDTFLTDRNACLRLMSSKTNQYGSLVDILSTFIQDYKSRDNLKRKEIDERIKHLEVENEILQEEMIKLKQTLLEKGEDARSLQIHLSRLESVVKSNKADKFDKCIGTRPEDILSPKFPNVMGHNKPAKLSKSKKLQQQQRGENIKTNQTAIGHKLSKSPYATKESPMLNGTTQPKISSTHVTKNGYFTDVSDTEYTAIDLSSSEKQTSNPDNTLPDTLSQLENRQQTYIEISEEKLEKLKYRAKKLESSLHEAISSMDSLNKSTTWMEKIRNNNIDKIVPIAHIQKVKASGNHHTTAKSIAYWKKSSFEVITSAIPSRQGFAGNTMHPVPDINKRRKEPTPVDIELNLKTEPSSLLEGRSIAAVPQLDMKPIGGDSSNSISNNSVSNVKLVTDRSQRLTPLSVVSSVVDGYHSDDEDRKSLYRHQQQNHESSKNDLSARSEISHKVRARRGQVKQIVSKCLRCQKLFSPTDNHKLACCYHSKDKERLEHYDHMGMLVRVIYVWKCCSQPQEADGCCYGKHV